MTAKSAVSKSESQDSNAQKLYAVNLTWDDLIDIKSMLVRNINYGTSDWVDKSLSIMDTFRKQVKEQAPDKRY